VDEHDGLAAGRVGALWSGGRDLFRLGRRICHMKTVVAAVFGLALLAPAAAAADGLPVTGVYGSDGVVSADGAYRYVTFPSGASTVVARLRTGGGVARYRTIAGRLTVPAVAYDRSTSGLAADGRTLVLIRPRAGLAQKRTRLAVLDARRLLVERVIVLRGDFGFDALSPDGSTAYLIQYHALSQTNFDPSSYSVRALDTRTGRLYRAPIVDPREPNEKMGGLPVTRALSPDARWAYTLYSGSEHPFVHALDTTGRTARCIDLDALTGRDDLFQMRLRVAGEGRRLEIVKDAKPVLLVDTRTFAVSEPKQAAKRAPQRPASGDDDGSPLWPWAGALGVLVLLAAASVKPLARVTRAR
jgi:hypothetical protein